MAINLYDYLAKDQSRLVEVLKFCKNEINMSDEDKIIQISPVAPFISELTLNQFANIDWEQHQAAATVSSFNGNSHPWLSGSIEDQRFKFNLGIRVRYPRQIRKQLYYPNGCIFARKAHLCDGNLETNDMPELFYPIVSNEVESINIDTELDWCLAKALAYNKPVEE